MAVKKAELYSSIWQSCDEHGWIMSKQIENFMSEEIKSNGDNNAK